MNPLWPQQLISLLWPAPPIIRFEMVLDLVEKVRQQYGKDEEFVFSTIIRKVEDHVHHLVARGAMRCRVNARNVTFSPWNPLPENSESVKQVMQEKSDFVLVFHTILR